jgi:hypothetical protein
VAEACQKGAVFNATLKVEIVLWAKRQVVKAIYCLFLLGVIHYYFILRVSHTVDNAAEEYKLTIDVFNVPTEITIYFRYLLAYLFPT